MNVQAWKDWSSIAESIATAAAIMVGGIWAFGRFVLQRESRAKIEFDLDLRVAGQLQGLFLVEVVAILRNKGRVRHRLTDFSFDLHRLTASDSVVEGDERINYQVLLNPVIRKRYWIPPEWMGTFIDSGVDQRYTYVTAIPDDTAFVLVYAKFKYPRSWGDFHTAQRLFSIAERRADQA